MDQGKRTKETTQGEHDQSASQKLGGEFKITSKPEFISHRLQLFDELAKQEAERIQGIEKKEITITLPDGTTKTGKAFETTALDIAKEISKNLAKEVITAKIIYSNRIEQTGDRKFVKALGHGEEHLEGEDDIYDLTHPFEGDCTLELIKFDTLEGKEVFWHSSAHILGSALENAFGIHLTHGPPLDTGFFYDFYMGENSVTPEHFKDIEKEINKIIKQNSDFKRLVITKEQALEMFKHNPFKVSFINSKIPDGAATSIYRSGTLVDLCPGPHVPSTGRVKAMKVMKCSATNWLGDVRNDMLQRVYGVSFPSKDELSEYVRIQEEIAKRDHRVVGEQQKLYTITKYAPGMPSFLPHGTIIYNKLIELMRREYKTRGFHEVNTPLLNLNSMWKTSGHYFKYKDNMFAVKTDEDFFGMKPMNCPCHCAMFGFDQKSYRDLPWRVADFGVLHRNELSGALSGLTRVRKFQQDDAHIFCTEEQIYDEILGALDFVDYIYGLFGFNYCVELSTRPPLRVGSDADWDKSEEALRQALIKFGRPFTVGEGEGAFYGPKIDILVEDCFKRKHQLGTIQLDFNLPDRFNLQYKSKELEDTIDHLTDAELEEKIKNIKIKDIGNEIAREDKFGKEHTIDVDDTKIENSEHFNYDVCGKLKHGFRRPFMIHRAVLGSLERCIAILIEVYGGKWPFWLSPRQAIVLPISEKFEGYAELVYNRLKLEGFQVDIDRAAGNIKKKVRNAQLQQFNYMLVVGEKEEADGTVNLRIRDEENPLGVRTIEETINLFRSHDPHESEASKALRSKAWFRDHGRLPAYESEICHKVFFDGEGVEFGPRDQEIYNELKDQKICPTEYPSIVRWKHYIEKKSLSQETST